LIDEKQQRLRSAQQRLGAARLLLDAEFVPDAISRMYYGVAEASRALLIEKGIDAGTHAGMINQLGLHYRDVLDVITVTRLRQDREGCDYELSDPPVDYARDRLTQARRFVDGAVALIAGGGESE
jgi:uncharacterized protein (UPF0332 family)